MDATSVMRNIDLDQLKELPVKKLILPIVLSFVASFGLESRKEEELALVSAQHTKLISENAKLQSDLNKFKSYESVKKTLDEDGAVIKTKLDTIKALISDRGAPLKILVSFSSTIPKDVWLTEFKAGKTEIRLKGNALGLSQISDFMKSLRDISYFSNVDLVDTLQAKDKSGSDLANFELNVKRRVGQSEVR